MVPIWILRERRRDENAFFRHLYYFIIEHTWKWNWNIVLTVISRLNSEREDKLYRPGLLSSRVKISLFLAR